MHGDDWSSYAIDQNERNEIIKAVASVVYKAGSADIELDENPFKGNRNFRRIEITIQFRESSHLLEKFINSRSGYRGHFYDSPESGCNYNNKIITDLRARLLDVCYSSTWLNLNKDEIERSIDSGKLWICPENLFEVSNGKYSGVNSRWNDLRWAGNCKMLQEFLANDASIDVPAMMKKLRLDQVRPIATRKLKPTCLNIKGGFVFGENPVHVVEKKRYRSEIIHFLGAS